MSQFFKTPDLNALYPTLPPPLNPPQEIKVPTNSIRKELGRIGIRIRGKFHEECIAGQVNRSGRQISLPHLFPTVLASLADFLIYKEWRDLRITRRATVIF